MRRRQFSVDTETKVSLGALLAVAVLVVGLSLWEMPSSSLRKAEIIQTPDSATMTPAVSPVFKPRAIEWQGYIRRIFISGEGLEVAGSDAPGGVFQVYSDEPIPITDGAVSVKGIWRGYTCAYGGNNGRCVPDVEFQSIERRLPETP